MSVEELHLHSQQEGEGQARLPRSRCSSNPEAKGQSLRQNTMDRGCTHVIPVRRWGRGEGRSPVDVRPDVLRRVVIDDTFDPVDVDASGRCVCADQPAGRCAGLIHCSLEKKNIYI